MIGATVTVKGEIHSDEDLLIEGTVEGRITCTSHLVTVGASGTVRADVVARTLRIEGSLEGDITGHEKVVITKTGRVRGNIVAPAMSLEDGAKFKGSIDMDPSPQTGAVLSLGAKPGATRPVGVEHNEAPGFKTGQ